MFQVCNHPELFERREPKSSLLFNTPPPVFPRLPFLDQPVYYAENKLFNIFRADHVHNSLKHVRKSRQYLEVSDSCFSFLQFNRMSPGELEQQHKNLFQQFMMTLRMVQRLEMMVKYQWTRDTGDDGVSLLIPSRRSLPAGLQFVTATSDFLHHADIRVRSCPESMSHRVMRSRHQHNSSDQTEMTLLPEITIIDRGDKIRHCVPTSCPR